MRSPVLYLVPEWLSAFRLQLAEKLRTHQIRLGLRHLRGKEQRERRGIREEEGAIQQQTIHARVFCPRSFQRSFFLECHL